jgi:Domain of unknown function (DUF4388)
MQPSRFSVLTGHLNDYPLADLVGILRHQHKTGRLLIEYNKGPGMFFFRDGQLVDAQLDKLVGLQALCVALAQPPAAFNFNPLIQPSRRTIEQSMQRIVSELLGCWDENAIDVGNSARETEKISSGSAVPNPALLTAAPLPHPEAALTAAPNLLALPPAPQKSFSSPIAVMAAAGLLMLGISTLIGVSGKLRSTASTAAPAAAMHLPVAEASVSSNHEPTKPEIRSDSKSHRQSARSTDKDTRPSNHADTRAALNTDVNHSETSADSGVSRSVEEPKASPGGARAVKVVLQIENGRVTQASIGNHKPGMDAYEALALRIARQRRYPTKSAGQQTIMISVDQPK